MSGGGITTARPGAGTRIDRAVMVCVLLAAIYIGVLVAVDGSGGVFDKVHALIGLLPLMALASFASFVVRYLRWRWLLRRSGAAPFPWGRGFLAYIAGFALTASPGKVGELLRIRYYADMRVPADRVIACFVFERLFDLFALLILALPLAWRLPGFWIGAAFVIAVLAAVIAAARNHRLRYHPIRLLRRRGWHLAARVVRTFGRALGSIVRHLGPVECIVTLALGLVAWAIQSLGFVVLMDRLGIGQPLGEAIAILPAGMLLGAASLIPGGIGTTEAAIVAILALFGVGVATGILAAVGARLATLWFAIVVGILACLALDLRGASDARSRRGR